MSEWQCTSAGRIDNRPLWSRFRAAWPLVRLWTVRDFHGRYRQHALDVMWTLVSPAVVLVIYGLVFTVAFDVDGDGLPYLSFAWAGLVAWTFFANSILTAVGSIGAVADTITKVWFPREVIPLATVGVEGIELVVMTAILLVLAPLQGIAPSVTLVALPAVLLVLVLWTAGLSVLGATVGVFLRDLKPAAALAARVGFIATPIMYPASLLPESAAWTVDVNPVAVVAEGLRDVVLRGEWPDWPLLAAQGTVATIVLVLALAYTRALEPRMADLV